MALYIYPDAPWCWYIYLQNWVIFFGQKLVNIPAPWHYPQHIPGSLGLRRHHQWTATTALCGALFRSAADSRFIQRHVWWTKLMKRG